MDYFKFSGRGDKLIFYHKQLCERNGPLSFIQIGFFIPCIWRHDVWAKSDTYCWPAAPRWELRKRRRWRRRKRPGGEDSVCGACGVGWAETMQGPSDPAEPEAAGHTRTDTQNWYWQFAVQKKYQFFYLPFIIIIIIYSNHVIIGN